tara:strand:+ start:276 stop:503 length:228 start_codon:yes stop_codon:yes gene_type:complete
LIGLIRLVLKFTWLGIMVLGARQMVEFLQQGLDNVVEQIDDGDSSGLPGALVKLHNSLHRRELADLPPNDTFSEL